MLALSLEQLARAQNTSSIRVVARADSSEAPIADVDVTVFGPQGSASSIRRTRTDAAGVALFENLPLGTYLIQAQREGYLTEMRAPILPSAIASRTLPLSNAGAQGIVFHFRPAGSISGRALDPQRKPIPNARVSILVQTYTAGHRTLLEGSATTTDSQGEYSLKQLGDGEYYVRLHTVQNGFDVYYPGVIEADLAVPVEIRNGGDVRGIELSTPSLQTFKISGTVVNSPGPVPSFTFASKVALSSALSSSEYPSYPSLPNRIANSSREFEISGAPPGSWDLFAIVPLERTGVDLVHAVSRPQATGRAHVDVTDRDVEGVIIVIGSATVGGQVVLKGTTASASDNPRGVRIALIPDDNIPMPLLAGTSMNQTPDDSGLFLFPYLPLGTYSILAVPQFSGWYVSDVRQGVRSIFDQGRITVGVDPIEPLEIHLSPGGGTIKGILQEGNAPARADHAELLIALVPQSQFQRDNLMLYKTTTLVGGPGEFTFRNVAPGNYKVIAWKRPPVGDPSRNAEFVARYESRGTPVSVKAEETTSVQVQLIHEGN